MPTPVYPLFVGPLTRVRPSRAAIALASASDIIGGGGSFLPLFAPVKCIDFNLSTSSTAAAQPEKVCESSSFGMRWRWHYSPSMED